MSKRVSGRLAGLAPFLAVLLVVVFFAGFWVRNWPDMPVYYGESGFSGESAYDYLGTLVSRFPRREAGTENAKASALWVAEEFRKIGLETRVEEFESFGVRLDLISAELTEQIAALGGISPRGLVTKYRGFNVVGTSPGEVREQIVIGAHRDVAGTAQGAEDNGSGTALMMELARVLANRPHHYTYVFVSFDAEEVGLLGSANYATRHRDDPVILGVCLDMTGHKDASAIWLYDYVTARGCSPLWTLALARSVMEAENLPLYYFVAESPGFPPAVYGEQAPSRGEQERARRPLSLFLRTLQERIAGEWNTDSGSFIERGIPAVGITAVPFDVDTGKVLPTQIHTPEDTVAVISPDVLEMAGRFVERYVESVNLNGPNLKGALLSRYFTRVPEGYLSPWAVYSFVFLASAPALAVPALRWVSLTGPERQSFRQYVRRETVFLVLAGALSFSAAGLWQLYRFEPAHGIPFLKMALIWLLTLLAGTVVLTAGRYLLSRIKRPKEREALPPARDRTLEAEAKAGSSGAKTKGALPYRRLLLDVVLAAIFLLEAITLNFFLALASVGIPLFFVNMLNAAGGWKKAFHVLGLVVWTPVHIIVGVLTLVPYGFSPGAFRLFLTMFLHQAAWVYGVVYSFGPDGPPTT